MKVKLTYRAILFWVLVRKNHFPYGLAEEVGAYFASVQKCEQSRRSILLYLQFHDPDRQKKLQQLDPNKKYLTISIKVVDYNQGMKYGLFPWRSYAKSATGGVHCFLYYKNSFGNWETYVIVTDLYKQSNAHLLQDEKTIAKFWQLMLTGDDLSINTTSKMFAHVEIGGDHCKIVFFER